MKRYRLVVFGENFLTKLDGKLSRCGFKAVRFVEAAGVAEARERVVGLLRRQLKERVLNVPPDTPSFLIEETAAMDSYEGRTEAGQGFEWFPERRLPKPSPSAKRYVFSSDKI
jgi:hypothetical protein